ncbi:MAG: LCP family protein [Chloroflexota bacterium]
MCDLKDGCLLLAMVATGFLVVGCGQIGESDLTPVEGYPIAAQPVTLSSTVAFTSTASISPTATDTLVPTRTLTPTPLTDYPTPSRKPPMPIPPPVPPQSLPEDIEIFVLMGIGEQAPFQGLTKTFILALVNVRYGLISLISLPYDAYLYIPGWTMQRLGAAYARGGFELLALTLEYNLGLRPTHWVLVYQNQFIRLVNAFGGLTISVQTGLPEICGGISAGDIRMDGKKAYCYVSTLIDENEFERQQRQQQVLRALFEKIVTPENLMDIASLYLEYEDSVQTNLKLSDLKSYIPLAVRLLDPQRVFYFRLDEGSVTTWEVPGSGSEVVRLPKREVWIQKVKQALDVLRTPVPLSPLIATLEAALTPSPTATMTSTPTPRPTEKATLSPTPTPATSYP